MSRYSSGWVVAWRPLSREASTAEPAEYAEERRKYGTVSIKRPVEEEVPAEPKKNEEKPFKPIKLDPELTAPPAPRRNARRKK